MNAGTKVFLAVIALLVGVMILYYGVFQTGDHPTSAMGGTSADHRPDAPAVRTPATPGTSRLTNNPNRSAMPSPGPTQGQHSEASTATIPPATDPLADLMGHTSTDPSEFLSDSVGSSGGDGPVIQTNAPQTQTPTQTPLMNSPVQANPTSTTSINSPVIKPNSTTPRPADTRTPGRGNTQGVQPNAARSITPGKPVEGVDYTWYTIKSGDTGESIAQSWFGEARKWKLISKANPLVDFDRLQIGQKLRLPPKNTPSETAANQIRPPTGTTAPKPTTESAPPDANSYTIKSGDTLTSIARAKYGDGSLWDLIYDANRKAIGDDPGALEIGMKLTITAKPAR